MIIPIDAEIDEAQDVREGEGIDRSKDLPRDAVRDMELQNHDRDENGDHAVAECF